MKQSEAGIRELKTHLSAYLREVKAGGTIVITERGRPIGRIVPIDQSRAKKMETLSQAGIVAWSGKRLSPLDPVAHVHGDTTVSELLLEDRE